MFHLLHICNFHVFFSGKATDSKYMKETTARLAPALFSYSFRTLKTSGHISLSYYIMSYNEWAKQNARIFLIANNRKKKREKNEG